MINKKLCLPYGRAFPFQTVENANSFSSFTVVRFLVCPGCPLCVEGAPCSAFIEFVL